MQNIISKVKWSTLKPLNQWPDTSTTSGDASGGASSAQVSRGHYLYFLFNPAVYSKADIAKLWEQCLKPEVEPSERRLRAGTQEECKIISSLAEGGVVGRRMPNFLKSVLNSIERLRLYRTIQAQVEG